MSKLGILLAYVAAGVGFLFFLGFGIGASVVAPEHALVIIDADRKSYFAPPCISEQMRHFPRITIGQARKLGLNPDAACRDAGGFVQEARSLSGQLLQKVGALSPLRSRWNADGSWNW